MAVTLQAIRSVRRPSWTLADAGLAVADLVDREAELHLKRNPKVNVAGIEELLTKGLPASCWTLISRNWKFALTSRRRSSPAIDATGRQAGPT